MFAERVASIGQIEIWVEFDEEVETGQPCKARVFTKNLVGRRMWLKVYDRDNGLVAEFPPRGDRKEIVMPEPNHDNTEGGALEPPVPAEDVTEELDLSIPYITLDHRQGGPLGLFLERQINAGATKEDLEARLGRKLKDPNFYPSPGLSVKVQGWPWPRRT